MALIVAMDVIAPGTVAALVNRNDTVALIDAMNEHATRYTAWITATISLPLTSAATPTPTTNRKTEQRILGPL